MLRDSDSLLSAERVAQNHKIRKSLRDGKSTHRPHPAAVLRIFLPVLDYLLLLPPIQ